MYCLVDTEGLVTNAPATRQHTWPGPKWRCGDKSDDDGEDNYGDLLLIRCINLGCVIRNSLQLQM